MPFPDALEKLSENRSFELKNSEIYLENIQELERHIKNLKEYSLESFYQLHLNNIQLLPGTPPATEMQQEHVLSGSIVEHSPRAWSERFTDVAITQMISINGFNAPLQFMDQAENLETQLTALKEALLSLLSQPDTWSSIELARVFFYKDQPINHALTQRFYDFYDDFLISLAKKSSLKELSIRPFSLARHRESLVCFLTQDTKLESLHLKINEANREDWLTLCQVLEKHPKLNSLYLDSGALDSDAYSALANLLDKNYRVKVTLSKPTDGYLPEAYLSLRWRLSKTGVERFTENHLSQNKLLQVAFTALESLQKFKLSRRIDKIERQARLEEQFDFLLTNHGHLALTGSEKEAWLKKARVLPEIYQNHKEYMKEYSGLVRLHLGEFLEEQGKTVGYLLLEKVLETGNVKAMKILLEANVNLLECPNMNNEDSFLLRLFRNEAHPALQKIVLQHMAEDASLMELALERFSAYSDICKLFRTFATKLSQYADVLVYKIDPPLFTSFARNILDLCRKALDIEVPSKKRKEEYAKIHLNVAEILYIVKDNPQGKSDYDSFTKAQKILQEMIRYSSRAAARGNYGRSFLHDGIVEFAEGVHQKLEDSKGSAVHEKDDLIAKQSDDLQEKDTTINDLFEEMKKQKTDLNEKFKKEEKQRKQEQEQHKQEKEQLEQDLAKQKQKEAAMQAEIDRLKRLVPAQNSAENQTSEETRPQGQERPGSSTRSFARR